MANELTFFLQKGQHRNHYTSRWNQSKNRTESIKHKKDEQLSLLVFSAEREGFEPPVPLSTAVFKTAVIDHSTTFPMLASFNLKRVMRSLPQKRCKGRSYFWNMQALFAFFVKKEYFFSFFTQIGRRDIHSPIPLHRNTKASPSQQCQHGTRHLGHLQYYSLSIYQNHIFPVFQAPILQSSNK